MYTYFWELDERVIVPVLLAYATGNALGTFVSVKLFALWGKKLCLILGGLSYAFFQNVPVVLRLLDWFPENGDAMLLPALIFFKALKKINAGRSIASPFSGNQSSNLRTTGTF